MWFDLRTTLCLIVLSCLLTFSSAVNLFAGLQLDFVDYVDVTYMGSDKDVNNGSSSHGGNISESLAFNVTTTTTSISLNLSRSQISLKDHEIFVAREGQLFKEKINSIQGVERCYQDKENGAVVIALPAEPSGTTFELHGIIKVFGEEFIIMPIIESADTPTGGLQNSVKHGIGKLRGNKAFDFGRDYIPIPADNSTKNASAVVEQNGNKGTDYVVEMLMVADSSMFDYWVNQSESLDSKGKIVEARRSLVEYFIFLLNGVDIKYNQLSTLADYNIRLTLAGIVIAEDRNASSWTFAETGFPAKTLDAKMTLELFSEWQVTQDLLPAKDHSVLFTRKRIELEGNPDTRGITYMSGVCSGKYSASVVNSGSENLGIITSTRLLGHSLSAGYVDIPGCTTKDDGFTGETFGLCSINSIKNKIEKLSSSNNNCLGGGSQSSKGTGKAVGGSEADLQCQAAYGPTSVVLRQEYKDDYTVICSGMKCTESDTPIIPNDGMSCGRKRWCEAGQCVRSDSAPNVMGHCPFGDQPGIVDQDLPCAELIAVSPGECYTGRCCESCASKYVGLENCEYGDRVTGCRKFLCAFYNANARNKLCCHTCSNGKLRKITSTPEPTTTTTMEPTTELLTTEQLTELVTSDLDWMSTFMTLPPLNLTKLLSTLKSTKAPTAMPTTKVLIPTFRRSDLIPCWNPHLRGWVYRKKCNMFGKRRKYRKSPLSPVSRKYRVPKHFGFGPNLIQSRLHYPMHSMKAAVEVEQRRIPVAKNRFVQKTRMALRRPMARLNVMRSPRRRMFAPVMNHQRIRNKTVPRFQVNQNSPLAQARRLGRFGFFPRPMYPLHGNSNQGRMRQMDSGRRFMGGRWRRRESRSAKKLWDSKKH
ncbi:uncharacterized protein LOC106878760 [Octopus bimaculoides]|nr:uncharacterized protein LOC106878760 [Octopus bimaculoides]